jgi:16S rRNA (cytosine967-C5)-methyltransferase
VRELAELQAQLLANAAKAVKPGGKLVFAVCTLTRLETTEVVELFTKAHPAFEPQALPLLHAEAVKLGVAGQPMQFIWPQDFRGNGMFIAQWRRVVR